MRLELDRIESPAGVSVAADGAAWRVANAGDRSTAIRSVARVYRVLDVVGPLRMFRHGYQSWSPCDVATVGGSSGELRSTLVTVLTDDEEAVLVGFAGGSLHDGTLRLRGAELWAEAFLGGAVLAPGDDRLLHDVVVQPGAALESFADSLGGRADAPFQVGWCSWYHYFHDVTEADVRANLALAGDWPFDVFQVDDGYQSAIGDWLTTNDRFPSGVDGMAAAIAGAGFRPGIWIAPFVAAPDSVVAREHPSWLARDDAERPLVGMVNEAWGGPVLVLDTTNPEVLAHLSSTAAGLVAAGYPYLKLDFTYAPGIEGVYADASSTSAQRVRAGFDAVRAGAGDDVFLLGCGAPIAPAIGAVDGMRIGPDVAPWWEPRATGRYAPSTANALRNTTGAPVDAPPALAQRPRLRDAAHDRDRPLVVTRRGVGARSGRLGRDGPGVRRPRVAGRRCSRATRRGDHPRPRRGRMSLGRSHPLHRAAKGRRVEGREPVQLGLDRIEPAADGLTIHEAAVEHGRHVAEVAFVSSARSLPALGRRGRSGGS